jgi:hypothetical protein
LDKLRRVSNITADLIAKYDKQILATNTLEELETLKASITPKVEATISGNDIIYRAPASNTLCV